MPPAPFEIAADGWSSSVTRINSPNFDTRPELTTINLLVIHNISLPPGQFTGSCVQDLFCNQLDTSTHPYFEQLRGLRVSAHFFIRRDGGIWQFVSCHNRAWHAGISSFMGCAQCNDFSIGIELEGTDEVPFTQTQYVVLARLTHALKKRYPLQNVVGHQHIAPGRKTDPGTFFDWDKYQKLWLMSEQFNASGSVLHFPI